MGASHDLSDGQEEIETRMLDCVKVCVFKFYILFHNDIFLVEFDKFRCLNTSFNAGDYANLGSFYRT